MAPSPIQVTLLTRDDCAFCHDAEEIIGRLSTEFGFELVRVDLNTPKGDDLAMVAGVLFPPGILIDGEPFSFGRPSERKLRRHLTMLSARTV